MQRANQAVFAVCRGEKTSPQGNVFDKPSAEGKSSSVCSMPRRENDCFEETNSMVNFDNVKVLLSQGKVKAAVDLFYDVLHEDDDACLSIPKEIGSNHDFSEALADVLEEKWSKVVLGWRSSIMLMNNYMFQKQKGWLDFRPDSIILISLKRMERDVPNNENVLMALANFYYLSGLYFSAMQYITRLEDCFVKQVSANINVQKLKIECMMELGWEKSVEESFAGLSDELRTDELLCIEAQWRREHGEYKKGIEIAREALLVSGGDNVSALFELGANMFFLGDVQAAEKGCFNPIIKMASYDKTALYYCCFVHVYQGDRAAAIEKLGLVLQESTAWSFYTAAEVFALLGEFEMAVDCLEKAEGMGFVSLKRMWNDCAFRELRETKEGAEVMNRMYGKHFQTDFQEALMIRATMGIGGLTAYRNDASKCYTTSCMLYDTKMEAVVSTGAPQTIVDWVHIVNTGLYGLGNRSLGNMDMPYKCYVPGVDHVKAFRMSIPEKRNKCGDTYKLQGDVMVPQILAVRGGIFLGVDRLGCLSRFTLKCEDSGGLSEDGSSCKVPFRYSEGLYVIKATLLGSIDYNSVSDELSFVVDTSCAVSYISRLEYNKINENGDFPVEQKLLSNETWDVVHCSMQMGECRMDNVEMFVVEEYTCARVGYNVLSRFKEIEFDNNNNLLTIK